MMTRLIYEGIDVMSDDSVISATFIRVVKLPGGLHEKSKHECINVHQVNPVVSFPWARVVNYAAKGKQQFLVDRKVYDFLIKRAYYYDEMLFRIRSSGAREFLAEFAGTFTLMVFGDASVAQSVLSKEALGNFFAINWVFGIAVMLGIFVAGGVTGGHLNPAVTLAMAICRKLPWKKVPLFFLAQYSGAFVAAAVVYAVYYEALNDVVGPVRSITGVNATAGIFATYPHEGISTATGLLDQVVGTALLLFCVRAITDEKNMNLPSHLVPFAVGFVVLNIGICFGYNCGYAINPARDFAPRLFSFLAGYGGQVFSTNDYWMFMPIIGPHLGAIVGSLLYDLFIGFHWPGNDEK